MVFTPTVDVIHQLQDAVTGKVLTSGSPDYDAVRQVWHLGFDHYPAVIVRTANTADVIAAVRFAREAGLGVAIQSTGHGMQYPVDGHVLIVTSKMQDVEVDPETRIATVEAGVVWQQVLAKSTPHGLAPLLGSSPHVGVIGYTLGGGIGWLARRYGLAADAVRWIELVTAEGELLCASPTENSELFWGLRGGGGNFGVVTRLAFNLYPVAKIYGGEMTYPGELAAEALRFYRDWLKTIPDEVTSSINVLKFPDMPQLPEALRGMTQVNFKAVYSGDDLAQGIALLQPWLDWHTPNHNSFREMPFADIGTVSNDPVNPTPGYPSNYMLNALSDEVIEIIVRYATNPASPLFFNELRHAGGAIMYANANLNAIGNREAQFYFQVGGMGATPEARAAIDTYRDAYKAELSPYLQGGAYLNFLKGGEAKKRIQQAYAPGTYQRLLALKAQLDPDNVFRFSYPLVVTE